MRNRQMAMFDTRGRRIGRNAPSATASRTSGS